MHGSDTYFEIWRYTLIVEYIHVSYPGHYGYAIIMQLAAATLVCLVCMVNNESPSMYRMASAVGCTHIALISELIIIMAILVSLL